MAVGETIKSSEIGYLGSCTNEMNKVLKYFIHFALKFDHQEFRISLVISRTFL